MQFIVAGVDHVKNRDLYTDSDLPLCTANGIHGPTIGEWIAMTLLVGSRKYQTLRDWHVKKSWGTTDERERLYTSISDNVGKRFGILGYGSIGRQAARYAQVMGMDILVYTARERKTAESKKDHGFIVPGTGDPDGSIPRQWFSGADKDSLHKFLGSDLDYLLLSLPSTTVSRKMLGREEFRILAKRNAFVLNCARGDIVKEDELIESLVEFEKSDGARGLSGYATDVMVQEPLPKEHPLWTAPNVVLTPHLCGFHKNYAARALSVLEVNLEKLQKGETPLNLIDRALGYSTKTV